MTNSLHTSSEYEHELDDARERVLQLGARVERQVTDAIASLGNGSSSLIDQVLRHEIVINALEIEIDALVAQIIARRQPTAGDLRILMAIIKSTTHLERIGDEAKKIALHARQWAGAGGQTLPRYAEIRRMAQLALGMLRTSLAGLETLDTGGANGVADRDLHVDDAFVSVLRQLISCMIEDPRTISVALDVVFIAKSLERIGDHAKNIAEQVIYAADGRDVRHASDPGR